MKELEENKLRITKPRGFDEESLQWSPKNLENKGFMKTLMNPVMTLFWNF